MRPLIIDINQHIGDNEQLLAECRALVRGDKLLFNAPTNSGKTTWAKHELCKVTNKSIAIAVPTLIIGHNKAEDGIEFYYEHNTKDTARMPHQEVYICTYEQLINIDLHDTIVIFDEAHNLANGAFRLENFSKALTAVTDGSFATIFMSATIEPLVWNKVYPNAKEIIIRQRAEQIREISFFNSDMGDTKANQAEVNSISEVINAKTDAYRLLVFVEHIATIRELEERYAYLNPISLTSEESRKTLHHSKDALNLIKTGKLPTDCRIVFMTSVGWEGFDILEEVSTDNKRKDNFLVINGLRFLSTVAQTPSAWYQMMSRPRLQKRIKMIVIKNLNSSTYDEDNGHYIWDGMDEDEIKSRYGTIQIAKNDKAIGKPYKYDAMMKVNEQDLTDAYTLQTLQHSFNKNVPTYGWQIEMNKYGLITANVAKAKVERYEVSMPPINNGILKYLLKTGTDELYHRPYQNANHSKTQKMVKGINGTKTKDKTLATLMAGFGCVQRRVIPTFDAYSKIESFYSDINTAIVSADRYDFLYENYELYTLRKLVWRKWAGKTFTVKEFTKWADNKWLFQKHPELLKHRKKILSRKAIEDGLIGKLFTVTKKKDREGTHFTLENTIPYLNSHFHVQWATYAVYKYYKAKLTLAKTSNEKTNAKRDYNNEVAYIVNEAWGVKNLDVL